MSQWWESVADEHRHQRKGGSQMSEIASWTITAGFFVAAMSLMPVFFRWHLVLAIRRSLRRGDAETLRLNEVRRVGYFYQRVYPYVVIGGMTVLIFGLQGFRVG